jgi:hypothetical protein
MSFEIDDDSLDMLSTNDSVEKDDPLVIVHFDAATTGRAFTKPGLLAVAELLLGHLWEVTLSPWKVSAGVLPFSLARRILVQVSGIWAAATESNAESGFQFDQESGPQIVH